MIRPPALLLGAVVTVAACGAPPETTTPATYTEIYERFFPPETRAQCNQCHSNPPNDISNGNLSMGSDPDTAYDALVGVTSTSSKCGGQVLIVAGDPEHSLFYTKTEAQPACGGRMPLGGSGMTDDEREMIRSWIAAGAPHD
jgi:uncharacterized membrane protein